MRREYANDSRANIFFIHTKHNVNMSPKFIKFVYFCLPEKNLVRLKYISILCEDAVAQRKILVQKWQIYTVFLTSPLKFLLPGKVFHFPLDLLII